MCNTFTNLAKLPKIIDDISVQLKDLARQSTHWNLRDKWLSIKYYIHQGHEDISVKHKIAGCDKEEIPIEPCIFFERQSPRRFNLKDHPVAYFSNDGSLAMIETVSTLKEKQNLLWEEDLKDFFSGKIQNNPENIIGVPSPYKVQKDSLVLDLSSEHLPSVKILADKLSLRSDELIGQLSTGNEMVYDITECISSTAYETGFDGIAYYSARQPNDAKVIGWNLIMWNQTKVKNYV